MAETHVELPLTAIAGRLEARIPELSVVIAARIRAEVGELARFDSEDFWATIEQSSRKALEHELGCMRGGARLPQHCPGDTAEGARLAAAARIPLTALLHTHRIGHAVTWDAFTEEVESLPAGADERRLVLDAGSRFFFAYADALASWVGEEHARALGSEGPDARRLRLVLDLLDGRAAAESDLGYDVSLEHVAVIAWGAGSADALRALARAFDRRALVVSPGSSAVWAWLGGAVPVETGSLRAMHAGDARLALGEPARGLDGFRRTHLEAHEAHRVAVRSAEPVVRYRDVALEAFALRDEDLAASFVESELGALGEDDRGRDLRDTVRAWFACSQNTAATAASLGVHEQTVTQRLRVVEERIGSTVNARRAELETALRLERLLAPR